MIARRGRIAFANARVRALKSRLFGAEFPSRAGASRVSQRVGDPASLATLADHRFAELIEWYACVLDSYPEGHDLFFALLRRHEIENVKLAWRVVARRHPPARGARAWLPMGELETFSRDSMSECRSLPALVGALGTTPYAAIAAEMVRAHPADALAAELGLDAWVSRAIVDAASALPAAVVRAREIALAIVRDRDLEVVRRAAGREWPGGGAIAAALAVWPHELKPAELRRLASWTTEEGPLWTHLPRRFTSRGSRPADWEALKLAWRIERRELCRRAFLDQPFSVAPAVALLILKEEEVRGLGALAESTDSTETAAACARALAGGLMGA